MIRKDGKAPKTSKSPIVLARAPTPTPFAPVYRPAWRQSTNTTYSAIPLDNKPHILAHPSTSKPSHALEKSPRLIRLTYNPHHVPFNYPPKTCAEVTRSGHIYKPPNLIQPTPAQPIPPRPEAKAPRSSNTSPSDITGQLKKVKVKISIWDLIHTSVKHKEAFLRVFQVAHVSEHTSPQSLEQMVATISAPKLLTYSINDLSPVGQNYNYPLYILVQYKEFKIPHTLIDDGAGVNVCLLRVSNKLGIDPIDITPPPLAQKHLKTPTMISWEPSTCHYRLNLPDL
jgi:hypothetical protein